jgi:hypothetical protein
MFTVIRCRLVRGLSTGSCRVLRFRMLLRNAAARRDEDQRGEQRKANRA